MQRSADVGPQAGVVAVGAGVDQGLRLLIVGLEQFPAERPAVEPEPGPRRHVDGVERLAPARPHVGRAAEGALAARRERVVGHPHDLTVVERLVGSVEVEAAALDQHHVSAAADQRASDGDPGSSRPDDRGIRLDELALPELVQVDERGTLHASAASARISASVRARTQPSTTATSPRSRSSAVAAPTRSRSSARSRGPAATSAWKRACRAAGSGSRRDGPGRGPTRSQDRGQPAGVTGG